MLFPIILAISGTMLGGILSGLCQDFFQGSRAGIFVATAAGMMAGCAIVMFIEACEALGVLWGVISVFVGLGGMGLLDEFYSLHFDPERFEFSGLSGTKAIRVFVLFSSIFVHSVGEGFSLGLSAVSKQHGSMVSMSLAIHNVPEAAALAAAFRSKGVSTWGSIVLSTISTLPQSVLALPVSYWFPPALIEFGMGISAGCMAWAMLSEMLPETVATCGKQTGLLFICASATVLVAVDAYSHAEIR